MKIGIKKFMDIAVMIDKRCGYGYGYGYSVRVVRGTHLFPDPAKHRAAALAASPLPSPNAMLRACPYQRAPSMSDSQKRCGSGDVYSLALARRYCAL